MKEKYQSKLLGAIHETSAGLHKIGVIDDKEMKDYDKDCLVQEPKVTYRAESPAETSVSYNSGRKAPIYAAHH